MRNIRKFNPNLSKEIEYVAVDSYGCSEDGLVSVKLVKGHGLGDEIWRILNDIPVIYEGGDGTGYYDENAATIVMMLNGAPVGYVFYWLDPPDDWVRIEDVAMLPGYLWALRYLLAAPLEITGKVRLELIDQPHFDAGNCIDLSEIKDSSDYASFVAALEEAGYEKVDQGTRGVIDDMYLLTKE